MNITEAKQTLGQNGYKLDRLYQFSSSNLSVLHANACKDFLKYPLSLHDFYCDMKRLESLEDGSISVGFYDHAAGFPTEINVKPDCLYYALNLIKQGYVEHVLVFERTGTDPKPYPVPAGKVYKLIK